MWLDLDSFPQIALSDPRSSSRFIVSGCGTAVAVGAAGLYVCRHVGIVAAAASPTSIGVLVAIVGGVNVCGLSAIVFFTPFAAPFPLPFPFPLSAIVVVLFAPVVGSFTLNHVSSSTVVPCNWSSMS